MTFPVKAKGQKSFKLAKQLLQDERFYRDGQPRWRRAPTAADASYQHRLAVKRLRRLAGTAARAAKTANKLEGCGPGRRCLSGACPMCLRAFQRRLVAEIRSLTAAASLPGSLWSVCVAPSKGKIRVGHLSGSSMAAVLRDASRTLADATPFDWGIFCIDVSFNDMTQKGLDRHWQVHYAAIVAAPDVEQLGATLRRTNPRTSAAPRTVRIARLDGSPYAISYTFKSAFAKRVSYWDNKGRSPAWNSRDVRLSANEHVELLLALDELGLDGRLLLKNVEINPGRAVTRRKD